MPAPPVSDEDLLRTAEVRQRHPTNVSAAIELNSNEATVRRHMQEAARRGLISTRPVMPGFEITKTTAVMNEDGDVVREFIQQRPARGDEFEPPSGHTVKGVSALIDGGGRIIQQWVKTKAEPSTADLIEAIRGALDRYERSADPVQPPADTDADLATVIAVADSHFGLYAHGREAGEDYDLTIADQTNRQALGRLIAATPPSEVSVVLGLGDLLHADNQENRTAKSGHSLDVDTRHSKVLQTAVLFMIHAVDLALQRHQRVIFRNLPGNHDEHSAFAVTTALWAWFRNEPRVTVEMDPSRFWWWRWGINLLGATHGDMAKMAQLPLVMAASRPEDWGQTKYRVCLTGHIHHRSVIETGGVIVESFQSTAARDAWHAASGFRSGRSLSAITYHREHGEISRAKVNIL